MSVFVELVADSHQAILKQSKKNWESALNVFELVADFIRYITLCFKTWLSH